MVFNAARPHGIPIIAPEPYPILVPCPVQGRGEVHPIAASEVRWGEPEQDLVVDCRDAAARDAWAPPESHHLVYDFLSPLSEQSLRALLRTPAQRVVVVGDGGVPDSGEEMGAELAGAGLRNVYFVEGGAPAAHAWLEEHR